METIQSLILGAVQGLTEFLPISSSGHLVIIPYLLGWKEHSLVFDVALHLGTVLALIYFFWRDWYQIITNALSAKHDADNIYPRNLLWQIVIASIPAGIFGFIIDKYIESYFHHPLLLAVNFALFGFVLWFVDKKMLSRLAISELSYKKSFLVGVAQGVALIPGVSRSGITMTAARLIGLDRENAARFSFLIGMPAMIGAFVFKMKDLNAEILTFNFWLGILASTIFGIFAIKFLLDYLKRSDFSIFMWYRFALAALIVILWLI